MRNTFLFLLVALCAALSATAQQNSIQLRRGSYTTTLSASPSATASAVYVLPVSDGSNGQVLSTNGSGTLSWTTASGVSSLGDLSDVKKLSDGNGFDKSIIIGHTTTGTLNPPTTNASYNYAFGQDALRSITDGDQNIAIGFSSLYTTATGLRNIAIGSESGYLVAGGDNNVAVGYQAGYSVVSANNTIAIGQAALKNTSGTTGSNNIAIGYKALENGPSLTHNIAIGANVLKSATTASDNIALGNESGLNLTTGDNNVLIGSYAGTNITTGIGNIFIGNQAGSDITFSDGSNKLIIDNSNTTSPLIYGNFSTDQLTFNGHVEVAVGTTTSTVPFSILGTGIQGAANVENAYLGTDVPTLFVRNTTNSADANAVLLVGVGGSGGASSAGDAYLSLDVSSVGGWSMGIDNSDSDKLKFLDSWDFRSDGGTPAYGLPVMTMTRLTRRVGIGTENPAYMLDVAGDINASGALTINGTLTAGNSTLGATTATYITALKGSATEGGEMYIEFGDGDGGWIIDELSPAAGDPTEERMRIFPYYTGGGGGETSGMSIEAGGNVGIGKVNPAYRLDVNGDIQANTTVYTSDARLKRNIQPIGNALGTVAKLRPVSYEKRADLRSNDYSMKQMGFIAQELESVLPNSVHTDKSADAIKSVDYISIIPVLTKALQEQQELIAKQQELVAKQQQEIDELKKMVKRMSVR